MAPYGAGHERLRLTGFGSFSPLKGGFLAFPLRNSGPCIGFRSPLPPGSRPAPRKVTLGPLAGVALFVMTECWLDLELQMSGPKKGETGSLCLLRGRGGVLFPSGVELTIPSVLALCPPLSTGPSLRTRTVTSLSVSLRPSTKTGSECDNSVNTMEHYIVRPRRQYIRSCNHAVN